MTIGLRYRLCTALASIALLLTSQQASAEPQNGWWWNPNESGRGFFIEMTGGFIYLAGYFYDANGRATWLSSGGPLEDPYSYSGTLQSYRGGQTVFGTYRPPAPAVDVGPVTLTFSDDSHGTLTWPGGTVQIEREIFGALDPVEFELSLIEPTVRPKTGWWWDPAESGSGYSVEIQGEHAFVVAFMYDAAGDPIWYFTAGPMSSPTHFESDWLEFSGGQTLTGPYRPPATPRNLGRVTIDFAANDEATITFTESALAKGEAKRVKAAKAPPRSRTTRARPEFPGPTWDDYDEFWPNFACTVDVSIHLVETQNNGSDLPSVFTSDEKWTYFATFSGLYDQSDERAYYNAQTGAYVDYSYESHDTHNDCRGHRRALRVPVSGQFIVRRDLGYKGWVGDPRGYEVTETTDSCTNVQAQPPAAPVPILLTARIGNNFSKIQSPTKFNAIQTGGIPYMKTVDTLELDDGSNALVAVDCKAF